MADQKARTPRRTTPKLTELDTKDFWQATKDKILSYQQCDDCNTVVFYPRSHCTGCTSGTLSWKTASGKGTIYSYSIVRQSYHPFYKQKVPYAVAWIDLDEGPRLMSNIVGIDDPSKDIKIGQKVEVEWEEGEKINFPLFKIVS
ncbi:MAG: Zn-ribbon domain-containing OB-fold protein [Pseudomonadales bacterium]|nr:Zn-ribbon domain-containing OB-fold protein [Pseudomonadales bacterium]